MNTQELRLEQARIRDEQRCRMDEVHALLHEHWRNSKRQKYGKEITTEEQNKIILSVHNLMHDFMRGFDEAVLIHERMAEIDGRDTKEVASALWPVRTYTSK